MRFNLLFILDMLSFDCDVIIFLWSAVQFALYSTDDSSVMSEALNSFSRCLIITVSRDHEGDKTK